MKRKPKDPIKEFMEIVDAHEADLEAGAMLCYDAETGQLEIIYPDKWAEQRDFMAAKDREFLSSMGIKP